MKAIELLNIKFEVAEIAEFLETAPYWNLHGERTGKDSPHYAVDDIYARWVKPGSKEFTWYYKPLTTLLKPITDELYSHVEGIELGGVLITRIPPGRSVLPHIDEGWHAENYSKYCVCIKADLEQVFGFQQGQELKTIDGEVFWFRNDISHFVINESTRERISLIVCIKTSRGVLEP